MTKERTTPSLEKGAMLAAWEIWKMGGGDVVDGSDEVDGRYKAGGECVSRSA